MSATTSLESLRETLAGEHSQLEAWVRESFAAMETLHADLSEWQRELTREQAALDQREAAVSEAAESRESAAVAALEQQLAEVREEARQLEEDNSEQLLAVEELDRQLTAAKAELRQASKRADELAAALEVEHEHAVEESQQFSTELRELRRMMERQGAVLEKLAGEPQEAAAPLQAALVEETPEKGGLAAELLRRASSRRAQRRSS